jgi:hypothetical protein
VLVMRRQPRNEELEFDYGSDSGKTVKFIALGLGSIVIIGGVLGGIVFLMKRPTANSEEAGFKMPSATGFLVSAASGGKVSPHKWDDAMTDVCSQMAGISAVISGNDDSSSRAAAKRAQRACRNGKF